MEKDKHDDNFKAVAEQLEKDEEPRQIFFKACLLKLGLQVNESTKPVPSLSPLYLSSLEPANLSTLFLSWGKIIAKTKSDQLYIMGENDKFYIRNPPESLLHDISIGKANDLPNLSSLNISDPEDEAENSTSDKIVDYDRILKHLIIHPTSHPSYKETPSFNHATYYSALTRFTGPRRTNSTFGQTLLYGEVVTSTSTLLEK